METGGDLSVLNSEVQVFGVSSPKTASHTVGVHIHIRVLIDVVFGIC